MSFDQNVEFKIISLQIIDILVVATPWSRGHPAGISGHKHLAQRPSTQEDAAPGLSRRHSLDQELVVVDLVARVLVVDDRLLVAIAPRPSDLGVGRAEGLALELGRAALENVNILRLRHPLGREGCGARKPRKN